MKKLGLPELFKTARMISDSGLKTCITAVIESYKPMEGESAADTQIRIGKQMFETLLDNIGNPTVERWLYETLTSLTEKKSEDIKALSLDEIMDILIEIKQENNLTDFFGKVRRFMEK